jgi:L-asparagine transporter-like permease
MQILPKVYPSIHLVTSIIIIIVIIVIIIIIVIIVIIAVRLEDITPSTRGIVHQDSSDPTEVFQKFVQVLMEFFQIGVSLRNHSCQQRQRDKTSYQWMSLSLVLH